MLFDGETLPVTPVTPLPYVMAPALAAVPLLHVTLRTRKSPLGRTVNPWLPMWSPAVEPTRLFTSDTIPLTPVTPLPKVTAPAPPPPLTPAGFRHSGLNTR